MSFAAACCVPTAAPVQITSEVEEAQCRSEAESARLRRVKQERETEDRGFAAAVQVWVAFLFVVAWMQAVLRCLALSTGVMAVEVVHACVCAGWGMALGSAWLSLGAGNVAVAVPCTCTCAEAWLRGSSCLPTMPQCVCVCVCDCACV